MNISKLLVLIGIIVWLIGIDLGLLMISSIPGTNIYAILEPTTLPALGVLMLIAAGYAAGAIFMGMTLTLFTLLPVAMDTPMTLAFGATSLALACSLVSTAGGVLIGLGLLKIQAEAMKQFVRRNA